MRDRDGYGQDRGRWGRDDDDNNDDRWMSDEDRRWRGQSGGIRGGQRYPEQSYGSRGYAQSGGYGQRESNDRGEFGGYYGGGQRGYGREFDSNREWSPGGDVRRRDYPSSFGPRGVSYGQRMDRPSERNYGVGYSGYGEENDRGNDDDRGLLERAGDWLQRKLGKAPKGYQRSDERIREDVCDLIMRRGDLDASDVSVTVSAGEVTLSGTVRDRHSKRRLEDIAEDVLGVNDVHNQVKVRRENETVMTSSSTGATSSSTTANRNGDVNLGARTTGSPGGSNDKSNRA